MGFHIHLLHLNYFFLLLASITELTRELKNNLAGLILRRG